MELKEVIYELETDLLKPEVRTSYDKLNELIADDFIEYGSKGLIYDKRNILERLPKGNPPSYNLYDFEFIPLSEFIIQTRFKTDIVDTDQIKTTSLRTSLWRKTNDKWQMFFHQGTLIK